VPSPSPVVKVEPRFRGEVIGFDDGSGVTVLRGVWTDGHGDRIFSQLKGDTVRRPPHRRHDLRRHRPVRRHHRRLHFEWQ